MRVLKGLGPGRAQSYALTSAGSLILVGMGTVNGIVLAWLMSVDERGALASTLQPVAFVSAIAILGLDDVAVQRQASGERFRQLLKITALAGAIAALLLLVVWIALDRTEPWQLLLLSVVAVGPLSQMTLAAMRLEKRWALWNSVRIAHATCVPTIFITLWAAGTDTLMAATVAILVPNLVLGASSVWAGLSSHLPGRPPEPGLLVEGMGHCLARLQTGMVARGDLLLITFIAPPRDVAFYVVALTYSAPFNALAEGLGIMAFSESPTERVTGPRPLYTALLALGVGGLAAAAAPVFIPLVFGDNYKGSVVPAAILAFASPLVIVRRSIVARLRASLRFRAAFSVEGTAIAVVVFGITGLYLFSALTPAAVATVSAVSYLISAKQASRTMSGNQRNTN